MISEGQTLRAFRLRNLSDMAHANPPPWDRRALISVSNRKYSQLKKFLLKRQRTHQGVIAFKDVDRFISSRGNVRVDWHSLLKICVKREKEQTRHWSPDYWMDNTRKEGLSFVALDDNVLIASGLYRAALARYALHYRRADTLYGVKVSQWLVDWASYDTYLKLKAICEEWYPFYRLIPERKLTSQTRQGQWLVDDYLLSIRRLDTENGGVKVLCPKEAENWLDQLRQDQATTLAGASES